jgi:hypothetical protein
VGSGQGLRTPVAGTDPSSSGVADGIRSVVRRHSGQVKACYEERLEERPGLAGRLAVDVKIQQGRVVEVSVAEDTTGDERLARCVVRRIKRWRFDVAVTDDIFLPFRFDAS